MSSNCMVCNGISAQYHFGATVCQACASFFRRYVNTKKARIVCNCNAKRESQYPCRVCRMKKCIAVGMVQSKVRGPRDNGSPAQSIRIDIKLRNKDRILNLSKNYKTLETTRATIFKKTDKVNLYDLSLEIKTDAKLMWRLCETTFAEFDALGGHEKKILFYNFHTKWSVVEAVISAVKFNDPMAFFSPSGTPITAIDKYYESQVNEKLSSEEVFRVFEPYWTYHFQNIIQPIAKLNLGITEYMALFGILLWDAGYANVGDSLAETCRAMRRVICRELASHYEELSLPEARFFETLDTLNLIERGDQKCQEEMQMCAVYDFKMDDDMRNLIMWDKF